MHSTIPAFALAATLAMLPAALTGAQNAPAAAARTAPLLTQELADMKNKEVVMLTVEYKPGQSTPAHRHNAHTFVYVLEGTLIFGVEGKEPVRIGPGQTFYENPTDVHNVARNASDTAPAKFLVFFIRDKGAATTLPAK
jgi:quercetin dioxygenase-like cupin family protein